MIEGHHAVRHYPLLYFEDKEGRAAHDRCQDEREEYGLIAMGVHECCKGSMRLTR